MTATARAPAILLNDTHLCIGYFGKMIANVKLGQWYCEAL
jgi:hypothetical protein